MQKVAMVQDEPFASASVLAQYKVFGAAKERGVTVLLDGTGCRRDTGRLPQILQMVVAGTLPAAKAA
jgi:hypothetical protein